MKKEQVALLNGIKASGQKIMTNMGNDYTLGVTDFITNMDLNGSGYTILDAAVPFYQIAIHGYVNYAGEALNLTADCEEELLKSAEYGAGLYFSLMDADATELQNTKYTQYFGANYEASKDELFAIYILKDRVIILSDDDSIDKNIIRISGHAIAKDYSLERFIYDFFMSFIEDELLFLQKIEHKITGIEEQVMKEQSDKFNIGLLKLKKIIARFYHYYTQLAEAGDELAGNEEEFFTEETVELFKMYSEKMTRLAQETQILREYAMQVQDVYQSEIEIHQNDVMKMLTIVTTIFLPLTLIAGWYGMNFSYMPELKLKYAYPTVIGISVLIVVGSLVVFKRKKYW